MSKFVKVPTEFEPIFERAQNFVSRYFKERRENAKKGTIEIFGQRYIFVRAASMSVEFFEMIKKTYKDKNEEEALAVARSLLFDIAHTIGVADARAFHKKMKLKDPIEKLSAGPVHFAHSGWAFVEILKESKPTPDENFYLLYDHPYSFESDSWIKAKKKVDFPVCVMNSGYSSGWCEESFGVKLVATEITCKAKGDDHCRFIMGHPSKINEYITNYLRSQPAFSKKITKYEIPGFFSRKTAEDELRKTLEQLEHRVEERTRELTQTNTKLKKEIVKRQEREIALRQSEETYRKLIETANDAIFVADADTGILINANKKASELIGLPIEKIIGLHQSQIHPAEENEKSRDAFQKQAQENRGQTSFLYIQHVSGKKIPVEISSSASELNGRRIVHGIFRDMTERQKLLDAERLREKKTLRYQSNLLELAKMDYSDLHAVFERISKMNAETLDIERVGVWFLYEEDAILKCDYLFHEDRASHEKPQPLKAADYPIYFNAIRENRIIAAHNSFTDDLTSEFSKDYLAEHDVRSLMDVPIWRNGKVIGVLCHEKTGGMREWSTEDQDYARATADMISIAIETTERRQLELKNQQYVRELEALARVSGFLGSTMEVKPLLENMLHTLKSVIPAVEKGAVMLYEEKNEEIYAGALFGYNDARIRNIRLSVDQGYGGLSIREGRGILINDVSAYAYQGEIQELRELKSAIVTPLITKKRIIGCISLETTLKTDAFTENDLRLLNAFAGTAAAVIENALLYEDLIQSESRYRTFVESFHDTIFITDYSMRMLYANPALERQTGYKLEDFKIIRQNNPFIHPDDRKRVGAFVRKFMTGSEEYSNPLENRFIDKQGNTHWYNSVISKITFNGQPALQFITYDITERKQAEDALAEEKELLMVTLRSIGDGVITTDVEGRIILMNQIAESLTGWTQEAAQGLPIEHVMQLLDPNTRKRLESPISNIITSTGVYEMTYDTLLIAKSGEEKLIADSGAPIRDKDGNVIGTVIVFRDVTDKRRMEAERVKTMKLESVGLLAGGIAHDFNNILTAVLGNIALAKMEIESNNRQRLLEILNKSEKSTFRAKELTQQLLTFSRGGNPIRKTTSVGELVRESADFMIRGSNVLCEYRIAGDLWPVDIDQGQISQVIHNLVINSVQAMPVGGVIKISAENSYVENFAGNMRNGNYVKITLRDQGVGIPKDHLSKVFDPYFTTKQKGSGLGLATCYSIIRNHDGYIAVESDLGAGSLFTIYLPASESSFIEKKEYKIAIGIGHGRILIMDDEEDIREITTRILNRLGYESVSTSDGKEAIRMYREAKESGKPFDVVIMGLTIPGGMGGKEAAKKLLEYDSKAKIIVASGYSNDPVMADYKAHGFSGYIVKPFAVEEFKILLHHILSLDSNKS